MNTKIDKNNSVEWLSLLKEQMHMIEESLEHFEEFRVIHNKNLKLFASHLFSRWIIENHVISVTVRILRIIEKGERPDDLSFMVFLNQYLKNNESNKEDIQKDIHELSIISNMIFNFRNKEIGHLTNTEVIMTFKEFGNIFEKVKEIFLKYCDSYNSCGISGDESDKYKSSKFSTRMYKASGQYDNIFKEPWLK